MTDRLRQIWSGFEQSTDRRLTGGGVENIHVPHRGELRGAAEPVPAELSEPAVAAFEALRSRLSARGRKTRRDAAAEVPPEGALAAAAPNEAARDLVRGLKATEARLLRSERVYGDVALGGAGRRRRKLFGLF